jgi:hypothetical protein
MRIYETQRMINVDHFDGPAALAVVFRTVQYLSILLNDHFYRQIPVDGSLLRECLQYIQSSLITFKGRLQPGLPECFRIGIMVLLARTFRLPGLYEHPCCADMSLQLQFSYAAAKAATPDLPPALEIWLLFVCLVSADSPEGDHLRAFSASKNAADLSWAEVRRHLKQVVWMDTFHDDLGKKRHEALLAHVILSQP